MARVLLDTNILIHREAATTVNPDIGVLYASLDKLRYEKCVHPATVAELGKHRDGSVRRTFQHKLKAYTELRSLASQNEAITALLAEDSSENGRIDTLLLAEVQAEHVDIMITEDRGIHRKAERLGLSDRVFTIEQLLQFAAAMFPEEINYPVLPVRRTRFGDLDLNDSFFESFRDQYGGSDFDKWFKRKADEYCYVCSDNGAVQAFLYLKREGPEDNLGQITPPMKPKVRLKIGTFKVNLNGVNLGERLLKIVFDNAILKAVDEIYVTIFENTSEQSRLIHLIESFGFVTYGTKDNSYGNEIVFVRNFSPTADRNDPQLTYPYFSASSQAYLVPIYPSYHTSLLPDSFLKTERSAEFNENKSFRNAIRKIYVSGSLIRSATSGDVLVFYRTGGLYASVVTSIGVFQRSLGPFASRDVFIDVCRRRSVLTLEELNGFWERTSGRPYVVEFLYSRALKKRINLERLIEIGVVADVHSAPRGFTPITSVQLATILDECESRDRFVVN